MDSARRIKRLDVSCDAVDSRDKRYNARHRKCTTEQAIGPPELYCCDASPLHKLGEKGWFLRNKSNLVVYRDW
ncbi:MAG: hypothetical protein UW94_C0014G0020 [Parcubacteria group bacterium GW2011_GWA2_45_14]|nr:MAG: hypothetical protein UW94_C0014G0020 [Parcubacteria group bacterium GW2011_GWA2_45_14]